MRYSVIGLGKLGACMTAAIASRGHDVVGVDAMPAVVEAVAAGRAPIGEPGLQELFDAVARRVTATTSMADAIAATHVTFVVVPTPSEESGAFSVEYAAAAFAEIGSALAAKDYYHLVVLTSTVLPGDCRERLLPVLEESSGRRAGDDFGFCYSPEFIALGTVVRDFLNPDLLLVGEHDERAGDALEAAYAEIVANGAACKRMSLENAELAKIALNSFVTMKIAFANTLAAVCERLPAGDVDVVTDAIGADVRIGHAYLRGGLGFGGPCFPRDNRAFARMARELGIEPHLAEATDAANDSVPDRIIARLDGRVGVGSEVAVLGLAYKPETSVTEASQAVELVRRLVAAGAHVRVFDPLADYDGPGVTTASSVDECVDGAEVVIVANPDKAFEAGDALASNGATIFDCWRIVGGAPRAADFSIGRASW